MYTAKPVQNEEDMLKLIAITTASTDATTDIAPFIPQSHGVNASDFDAANFIPIGKGIPMNNPNGNRIVTAIKILSGVVAPWKLVISKGVNIPNITRIKSNNINRKPAVPVCLGLTILCVV